MGIGLNIAKQLTEQRLHGKLTADNTSKGARFTLQLGACRTKPVNAKKR